MNLPLPRFASHPLMFVLLAVLHVYLGAGHVLQWLEPTWTWTDIWKGFGALAGTYYFLALASQRRTERAS